RCCRPCGDVTLDGTAPPGVPERRGRALHATGRRDAGTNRHALMRGERMSQQLRSGRAAHAIILLVIALTLAGSHGAVAQTGPSGEAIIAWHVVIAPTWLDPS